METREWRPRNRDLGMETWEWRPGNGVRMLLI